MIKPAEMLTSEALKEALLYDPSTGIFTRLKSTAHCVKVGDTAGTHVGGGRYKIALFGRRYYAHRLAWFYTHGVWPEHEIDHLNGNPSDNRIVNLRDVPKSINQQNRKCCNKNNKQGLLGVMSNRHGWKAEIRANGQRINLGTYKTQELAHAAYLTAKRKLHEGSTL